MTNETSEELAQLKNKEELVSKIYPNYQSEAEGITANSKLTETDKLVQIQNLDKALLNSINERIKEVEKYLVKKSQDEVLKKELSDLQSILAEVETKVEEREQLIASKLLSEIPEEQRTAKTLSILDNVSPNYRSELSNVRKESIESLTERKKELALEENLSIQLKKYGEALEKQITKQPLDKELLQERQLLSQMIEDNRNRSNQLKEDIRNIENGKPLIAISEKDLKEEIEALDSEYAVKKQEIEASNMSKELQSEKLLELERDLSLVLNARMELVSAELKSAPFDRELIKEQKILEKLTAENAIEISKLEENIEEGPLTLSVEEEQRLVSKIEPSYLDEISAVNSGNDLSTEQKLDAQQTLDEKLLSKIYDRVEQLDDLQTKGEITPQLAEERSSLGALSRSIESRIQTREKELETALSVSATTELAKRNQINAMDPTYENRIQSISNNSQLTSAQKSQALLEESFKLKEKVRATIAIQEDQLEDNTTLEDRKKLITLRAIDEDLSIENSAGTILSSEKVRADLINDLDRSYESKTQSISQNVELSEIRMQELLLAEDKSLLEKVTIELNKVTDQITLNSENKSLVQRQQQLKELSSSLQQQITDRNTFLASSESQNYLVSRQKILDELQKGYSETKIDLLNSKMNEVQKNSEVLKLEQTMLSKLENEKSSLTRSLEKNPNDSSIKSRSQMVNELIQDQKKVVQELDNQQKALAQSADREKVVAKVDESYANDLETIRSSGSNEGTLKRELAREQEHFRKINEQLSENDQSLAQKKNSKLEQETDLLNQELILSKARITNLETKLNGMSPSPAGEEYISQVRAQGLGKGSRVLESEYSSKDELLAQDRELSKYELLLKEKIDTKTSELNSAPGENQKQQELNWLNKELTAVQTKRRQVKISLGELEKIQELAVSPSNRLVESPELRMLDQEENRLQEKMKDPALTNKERKENESLLNEVSLKKQTVENKLLTEELTSQNEKSEKFTEQLISTSTTPEAKKAAVLEKETDDKQVEKLLEQAEQTKDPAEKNYLTTQAINVREASNREIQSVLADDKLEQAKRESGAESLETIQELEAKKRRYTIKLGELEKLTVELDQQISETKPKAAKPLIDERSKLIEQQELLKQQIESTEKKIAEQRKAEERNDLLSSDVLNQQVSYQEEREIASSEEYKRYVEKSIPALELEKQITNLEADLQQKRSESKELSLKTVTDPSVENKQALLDNSKEIARLEQEIRSLNKELAIKQTSANAELPSNSVEAMKMQNLLKRGIEPVQRAAVIAALIPMPSSGLEINKTAVNIAKPIPVNVKSPTGLVYRVQVGAFAKPIPEDRFKEFNPVSGETLNNGITRYMAGYFNSSKSVIDARDRIRAIGYADAFAIAYCDGKRISIAEAKALEASGRCLPKGENELIMEMAVNTAEVLGVTPSDSVLPVLPETDYALIPGGVNSEPVEKHPGLFYTVQVGVFNNPMNAKVVQVMQPLISNRLPNGQIRYSSGMFASVDEARPKKQEAIDKGIKDAFITAYYKSQRITLAEAQQLLTKNGTAILEPNRTFSDSATVNKSSVINQTTNLVPTEIKSEVKIDPSLIVTAEKKIQKLQIVTKKTYEEFPREILNRYNSHGTFYYDELDKHVKSVIVDSPDDLPQVYYFRNDIDTLIVEDTDVRNGKIIRINVNGSALPGDFTDWLLRYNYRREFARKETFMELSIFGVPEDKLDFLKGKLEEFGLSYEIE
ncbi:MAG: hypothetical protein LW688_09830 [Cryomorphaceae bacterium]|nr:hypothetical protein [Cryomorphaceae bacterium]